MNINKSYKFRLLFFLLLTSLPLVFIEAQAEVIKSFSSAINKAGRQRMLTQRIVKAYSMVGLDVQIDNANEQLLIGIELFEKQLSELKIFIKNKKTKNDLAKVEALWQPFKKIALGDVTQAGVKMLIEKDEALLKAAHQVVLDLQKTANSNLGRIVNISGRQRMLSQRIAKFYMLAAWQLSTETSSKRMQLAGDEFSAALDELSTAKINTPKIKASLNDARLQWSVFERSFRMKKGTFVPLLIAMSSEKILNNMNDVTGLYAKLGK